MVVYEEDGRFEEFLKDILHLNINYRGLFRGSIIMWNEFLDRLIRDSLRVPNIVKRRV